MIQNEEITSKLYDYIVLLSQGEKTLELYEKYKKYLEACAAEEVNAVIDKYIKNENDYDYIEKIVAQFIRACEKGLDSKIPYTTSIPFLSLLLRENTLIEEHKNKTSQIYIEIVKDFRSSKEIKTDSILKLKDTLIEYLSIRPHYLKIQNSLFPMLEKYTNNMNCIKLMWHIQDGILKKLKILIKMLSEDSLDFDKFNKIYGEMYLSIGKLLYREKNILLPLAEKVIPISEFNSMILDFEELGVSFNANLKDLIGGKNMSENLNNNQKRKDELSKIIKALNEAKDNSAVQKEIKKDFKTLLDTLSPEEIAEAEQALIAEGVAVEEVQKLCELHVDTFHDALKNASKKESSGSEKISGHPIANYRAENKELKKHIKSFKKSYKKLKRSNNFDLFNESLSNLALIDIHYTRKENQLFPFLEDVGFSGPSKVMWGKHDEIRDLFSQLSKAVAEEKVEDCVSLSKSLIPQLKRMVFMEEKILFPTALRKLPESKWVEIRKGESEIGYAWIKPGNLWAPEIIERPSFDINSSNNNSENDLLDLSIGKLSISQIDLMLKTLPIDITFVDENDKVRYFSQGKERIFPRSPGIIGRDVQNCHPPKSVHVVQKIVSDFKEKKRDSAEFWIQMNGSFIHIRYFPLFEGDVYKGVIEVSQEISGIRALEGEKRLLDEEK
ncbi:MAG: DUF438 domain-containing protein [Pleomorphochaeta sp.]